MSLMNTPESENILMNELEKSGFFDTTDCEKAWIAFKKASDYQFNCADDAFLWETSIYTFKKESYFLYSMTRQFSHEDDDGEYDRMEQLHINIYFKRDPVLDALEDILWSYDFDKKDDFFSDVEMRDSFKIPPSKFTPVKYEIIFEKI